MREGYILLYRTFLDNPLLNIKPFCKGYAWIQLISLTNHKTGWVKVKNGTLVKVQRGECGYSEKALADIFGWSRNKLRRFLEQLKNEKMIQQKIVENHSIIKILNYNKYQTIQQKNEKKDNKRNNKRTQTINDNEIYITKEYIYNTHTSKNVCVENKNLSDEDLKILKKYAKENGAKRIKPYVSKLIENGGYIDILKEEKERLKKLERQKAKEVIPPAEKIEKSTPEEDKAGLELLRETVKKIRKRG